MIRGRTAFDRVKCYIQGEAGCHLPAPAGRRQPGHGHLGQGSPSCPRPGGLHLACGGCSCPRDRLLWAEPEFSSLDLVSRLFIRKVTGSDFVFLFIEVISVLSMTWSPCVDIGPECMSPEGFSVVCGLPAAL